MKTKLKFMTAIVAVALMVGGVVLYSSVQTSAATAPFVNILAAKGSASTPVSAPCGLSFHVGEFGGALKIAYYRIRNCSNSTVRRKLEIAGTTDGQCHTIRAHDTVSGSRIIAGFAVVRGLKSC